jgi:hypothetical protein
MNSCFFKVFLPEAETQKGIKNAGANHPNFQFPLLLKITEFLILHLDLDKYIRYKLRYSSVILINRSSVSSLTKNK